MLFKDRVGIVADISILVAQKDLSIISMEVEITNGYANVYLEIGNGWSGLSRANVFELLGKVPGVEGMKFVETLPQEMREKSFRVILDNIRDGVISIDTEGRVTTFNRIVEMVLDRKAEDVLGKHITELPFPDYDILECLNGKKFTNVRKEIITSRRRFQYFSTCRPITDSKKRIVGAVEIGKDVQEIRLLAQSIAQPNPATFSDFIGQNSVIRQAIIFAQRLAKTDSIVSIRGESGTGKDIFARAIHAASNRKGPFVPINCAALPETLLESELFGYVGGAFTGASKEGKPGLFETASGGTLFLDEIGEIPFSLQAKLLRVIEEKSVRRVGASKEVPIDTRIITASNENLEQMLRDKLFREDLYYRINVLPIHLPPLRDRVDDIPLLTDHFLFRLDCKLENIPQSITTRGMDKLCAHKWPGNVRELKNVIERAAILCESDQIDVDCILFSFEIGKTDGELRGYFQQAYKGQPLQALLDLCEKQAIRQAMEKSKSIRQAAKCLGVSHTALLHKVRKHKIQMET